MKKLLLVVGLMMVATGAFAYEIQGNPDKCPSLGFTLGGEAQSGTFTATASGFSADQNINISRGNFGIDARFPVSNWVTLSAALGGVSGNSTADETAILNGGKSSTSGLFYSLNLRWYIH